MNANTLAANNELGRVLESFNAPGILSGNIGKIYTYSPVLGLLDVVYIANKGFYIRRTLTDGPKGQLGSKNGAALQRLEALAILESNGPVVPMLKSIRDYELTDADRK